MSDPQNLRETTWRRPLTPAEEAELRLSLAANPELQADLESENNLTSALNGLRDVPTASNFTARVIQAIESETRASTRRPRSQLFWRSWFPKFGLAATALCAGVLLLHHQRVTERIERAQNVAAISKVALDPALLKDFKPISQMGRPSVSPDEELLALAPLLAQMQ